METTNKYEKQYATIGRQFIVGMDEAGRGPLAGPLVVAAVLFPVGYHHEEIYDSKKVSEKKRKQLFKNIIQDALEYHIQIVDVAEIDELNIYRATQKAMEDLVDQFVQVDAVLTDAMPLQRCKCEYTSIIKGDQQSVSIAAASILAKVTRDCIMSGYDVLYPQYGFSKHKGYGTALHLAMLSEYGVCKIHRMSYAPCFKANQMKLF